MSITHLSTLEPWTDAKQTTGGCPSILSTFSLQQKPKLFHCIATTISESSESDSSSHSKFFKNSFHVNEKFANTEEKVSTNDTAVQSTSDGILEGKLRPHYCTQCGKTFMQKHHLTAHQKIHLGIRPHICNHCGKAFTHKHCLNTHLLLHSSERPYQCDECKKSFTLKHHLMSHRKVHSREKPFECAECGCAFPLKRHLVTHYKFHAGERPYLCEECGESFANKEHLVMHARFHGSTESFVCHDCGATFSRKFELVEHGRVHGHVPFRCPLCLKEFLQKRTLTLHMRIHTDVSPFVCVKYEEQLQRQNCDFSNHNVPASHVGPQSEDTNKTDNSVSVLTTSLIYTSGSKSEQNDNSKVKLYSCNFCSRGFSAKHGLQQHNRRHPEGTCNVKSHVCEICGKAFYQKNHLLLHKRQHMDPSMRIARRSVKPNDCETVCKQSEVPHVDLCKSNAKVITSDESALQYSTLLPCDGCSFSEMKMTNKKRQSQEAGTEFIQENSDYALEVLDNVDVKMEISSHFIDSDEYIKAEYF